MLNDEEAEEIREKLLEQMENLPEEHKDKSAILKKQIKNATNEQLEQFVRTQTQAQNKSDSHGSECIFCQIVEGKLETIKIYEDSDILAVLDVYPAALGHMLVMPKEHFESLSEMPDALISKLFLFIKALMPVFLRITNAKSFNLFIAQGDEAGQHVKHVCINLIPRFSKDKINFEWQRAKVEKKELEKLGEKLRKEAEKSVREKLEVDKEKAEKKKKVEDASEAERILRHTKRRMP